MSLDVDNIFRIYDEAKNKILLYVRSAVSSNERFEALRKLILDELGKSGAEGKVRKLMERNGQAGTETCKGGGGDE
jgi:hypothetical protein